MSIGGHVHEFKHKLYCGITKQSAYATGNNLSSGVLQLDTELSTPLFRADRAVRGDENMATGVEGTQRQFAGEISLREQTISLDASFEALGLFFGFALGDDTIATVATGEYSHNLALVAAGTYPGAMTIEDHSEGSTGNTTIDATWHDVTVRRVSLSWGRSDWAKLSVTLHGSGRIHTALRNPGTLASVALYIPCNKIATYLSLVTTGGTSKWDGTYDVPAGLGLFGNLANMTDPINLGQTIESGEIWFENPIAKDRSAGLSTGAGIYGEQPVIGRRTAGARFTLALGTSTDDLVKSILATSVPEYTLFVDITSDRLVNATNPYHAALVLPLCSLAKAPESSSGDGIRMESLEFVAKNCYAGTLFDFIDGYVYDQTAIAYGG